MIAYDRLSQIVPSEQALGCKGIATAFQQIPGVTNMDSNNLAIAFQTIQTTQGLPIIASFSNAVPSNVANFYVTTLGQYGTGADGTVITADILGTAEGWNETGPLINTVAIMANMNLSNLEESYQVMSDTVNGIYGNPTTGPIYIPFGPAEGFYDDASNAFLGIVTQDANSNIIANNTIGLLGWSRDEISNVLAVYPGQVAILNSQWTTMAAQVNREINLQSAASLNWAELVPNDRNSIYGLIQGLSNYSTDTVLGGTAQLLEEIATPTEYGEAIIGCLRQGRNATVLSNIGISINPTVPDQPDPPPPQAPLWPPAS